MEGKIEKFMDNATVYFSKTTNRELYHYRNILEFSNDSYVLVNPISDENIKGMRENMDESDLEGFDKFLERNWGIKPQKFDYHEEVEEDLIPSNPVPNTSAQFNNQVVNNVQPQMDNLNNINNPNNMPQFDGNMGNGFVNPPDMGNNMTPTPGV